MSRPGEATPALGYVGALDGIRAVAIVGVLLDHTSPYIFSSGQLGVDVFFTLSGFLITSLLLSESSRQGRISLGNFYMRRALRLLPCMLLTLTLAWVLAAALGTNAGDIGIGAATASVLLYATNWVEAIRHAPIGFLSHMWSLAIEEQFYVVWALALASRRVRQRLHLILPAAIVLIAVVRIAFVHVPHAFLWTVFRADELLIGALLATILHRHHDAFRKHASRAAVGWTGAAGLLALAVLLPVDPYPIHMRGGFTLVGVLTAMVIAHVVAAPERTLSRALSWRPAVALGRVSYGVYLLHFPLFLFALRVGWSNLERSAFQFGLTPVLVVLSWRFIEQPALRLKNRIGHRRTTTTLAAVPAIAAASAA